MEIDFIWLSLHKLISDMKKRFNKTGRSHLLMSAVFTILTSLTLPASQPPRVERLIDSDWTFSLIPDSTSIISMAETVDLPHDWSVRLPFDRNAPAGNDGGYLPTGKGLYTRTISIPATELKNARYSLLFEGVYERWTLKINGDTIGFRPYGYSSVIYDVTASLVAGENRIEVSVDNSNQKNSRWYTGSGIYRHVWLIKTGTTHIKPWSLAVRTPEVSSENANIDIEFMIAGHDPQSGIKGYFSIVDRAGATVCEKDTMLRNDSVRLTLNVPEPSLWSPEKPSLYRLTIRLYNDKTTKDEICQTFGIRTISFSPDKGMKLNGKPIVLNGCCVHHDNGILGAASFNAAEARKVRLLKEAGFNAVRTSHNPPSPAFLDECDRQGLLVIDEAFDGWRDAKNLNDYSIFFDKWAATDVGDMVRRDRNHPSIIAWSIGNEVIERKKIEIITTARRLASVCRHLDPTRPVTQALCAWDKDWEIYDPLAEQLDIVGYNYMIHKSEADHKRYPDRIMWQTESYPCDAASNWHKVIENQYIIGDFVWTGIDYIGESGIGRYHYKGKSSGWHMQPQWPWHGAYCGDIDMTGLRKPISHYRDMLYNDNRTLYMAVREPSGYFGEISTTAWAVWPTWESWNWKGHEGKPIEIEILSRYPKVRLYINDTIVGEKESGLKTDYKTLFTILYTPGTLKATGLDENGVEMESIVLKTAGKPGSIRLTPDRTEINNDGQDICFVIAEIIDKDGNVVTDADREICFSADGQGSILASGNGDPGESEPYYTPQTRTWKGRAIVAVRASEKKGNIKLTAHTPGIKSNTLRIKVGN